MNLDIKRNLGYFYSVVIRDMSFFGSYAFFILAVIFFALINQTDFAWKVFNGVIIFTIIEVIIKVFYKHKRPDFDHNHPAASFARFEEGTSFPSGHTGKIAMFMILLYKYG